MKRQQWIAMLAKLTAPMHSAVAAKAFTAYLPMLADLPDEAFCQASLEAVVLEVGHAPPYGVLRKALGEWWRQHRPTPIGIEPPAPPPPRPPPDDTERAAVSRTVGMIIAGLREVTRQREFQMPALRTKPFAELSREQLAEAYRRAGLAGPHVPTKLRVVAAAADIRAEVKRGPP